MKLHFALVLMLAAACNRPEEAPTPATTAANPTQPAATNAPKPPAGTGGGGSDTITPLGGPALGGATPVVGGENLGETTGGAPANRIKDMARQAGNPPSGPTPDDSGN